MYRSLKIVVLAILSVALVMIHSCQRMTTPSVTTISVTNITQVSAQSGGIITDDGGAEIIERGICWSTSKNPTLASNKTVEVTGAVSFISFMTALNVNTRYYVRAYASNSEGISYGNENSFITNPIELATVTTINIASITPATAVLGGSISFDGGAVVDERGVCWSTNQNPTTNDIKISLGSGTGSFSTIVNCLSFATRYYVRAYAVNSAGIAYGDQQYFTTSGTNPIVFNSEIAYSYVSDIDGNCYKTVRMGYRTWMAENLRTSRYNDGTPIPNITNNDDWINLAVPNYPVYDITGAFCWYNNDSAAYENGYGKLYNFGAVKTGKICPAGWHVPSASEILSIGGAINDECYLGEYLGGAIMETGQNHWFNPSSQCINNETGFTALPGGLRDNNGIFENMGYNAYFWSSSTSSYAPWGIFLRLPHSRYFGQTPTSCSLYKIDGLSVRCVKD